MGSRLALDEVSKVSLGVLDCDDTYAGHFFAAPEDLKNEDETRMKSIKLLVHTSLSRHQEHLLRYRTNNQ